MDFYPLGFEFLEVCSQPLVESTVGSRFSGFREGGISFGQLPVGLRSEEIVGRLVKMGKLATDNGEVHERIKIPRGERRGMRCVRGFMG
jgi:hypothetical protein